jgi:hypothetical protein
MIMEENLIVLVSESLYLRTVSIRQQLLFTYLLAFHIEAIKLERTRKLNFEY